MHDLLATFLLAGATLAVPATAIAPTPVQPTAPEPLATAEPAALPAAGARRLTATAAQSTADLTISQAIGQRLITRYAGPAPTASVLRALRDGKAGGVILFADNAPTPAQAGRAARQLRAAAAAGGQLPPLIMVDQEGGMVKRLPTLPPHRSAAQLGATASPEQAARATGVTTGKALRAIGVDVDLAPVADVPGSSRSFLGSRAFSRDPAVVARAACGFADGLAAGKVAATLKHFPGLGRAGGNTDLRAVRVTAPRAALQRDLAAYRRCAPRVPLVMLASAAYPSLGISRPAVVDPRSYALLAETGFTGLTVSDAIDTPALAAYRRPDRAALLAGLDLVLYTHGEAGAQRAHAQLSADVSAGRIPAAALRERASRIAAFKQRLAGGQLP